MERSSFLVGFSGKPDVAEQLDSAQAVAIIHEMGLDAWEMAWVQTTITNEAKCNAIKEAAQMAGIALSVHGSYYINLNAEEDKWPAMRERLAKAAYYADLAGATDIIFHPGSKFEQPENEYMPRVIGRLKAIVEEAQAMGNHITFRPETTGKKVMIGSVEEIITLCHAIPGVAPCIDFAHLYARQGDGTMNTYSEWCNMLDFYQAELGKEAMRRMHVHLSGIQFTSKGEKKHLNLPESSLDLGAVLQALWDRGCGGRLICESPDKEKDVFYLKSEWEAVLSRYVEGS